MVDEDIVPEEELKIIKKIEKEDKKELKKKKKEELKNKKREKRERKKREKLKREVEQSEMKKTEKMARELEIEPVKPKELKLRKLKKERKIRLIPSKTQAKVMVKEAGIGLKEGFEKAKYKFKSKLALAPEKTKKLAITGIKKGVSGITKKIEEEQKYRRKLIKARKTARLYAQKRRIYREELLKVGIGRKHKRPESKRLGINMPIFQPRQGAGFKKKTNNTLPLFEPRRNNILLENKSNNRLSIGRTKPLFKKRNIELFNFKKRNKK